MSTINWASLVLSADDEYQAPPVVYETSPAGERVQRRAEYWWTTATETAS